MTIHRYRAHGLEIRSGAVLPLPPSPAAPDTAPDLVLRVGADRRVPEHDPPGQVLAALGRPGGGRFYCFTRTAEAVVLRYPGLCEFVGDPGLSDVVVRVHPGADPGLVPVLAAGALVAVHLKLRHALVLHAGAVVVDGRALAFVGASGMGKSTLTAALCRDGHGLITDDVLRVERGGDRPPFVHPGSSEVRLRPAARELADSAPAAVVRATADGRISVVPSARTNRPLALAAVVVPLPDRAVERVTVRRLSTAAALVRLVQFPRVVGWQEPATAAAEFQSLADLAEQVPVYEASIPWGPPFRPGVLSALVDATTGRRGNRREATVLHVTDPEANPSPTHGGARPPVPTRRRAREVTHAPTLRTAGDRAARDPPRGDPGVPVHGSTGLDLRGQRPVRR